MKFSFLLLLHEVSIKNIRLSLNHAHKNHKTDTFTQTTLPPSLECNMLKWWDTVTSGKGKEVLVLN
jgi:hypothetical protein